MLTLHIVKKINCHIWPCSRSLKFCHKRGLLPRHRGKRPPPPRQKAPPWSLRINNDNQYVIVFGVTWNVKKHEAHLYRDMWHLRISFLTWFGDISAISLLSVELPWNLPRLAYRSKGKGGIAAAGYLFGCHLWFLVTHLRFWAVLMPNLRFQRQTCNFSD